MYRPPRKIPLKERRSIIFVERGQIDVKDGAFVVIDKNGVRTHIPIGGLACLMLEPGTRISHAAVKLAAQVGCLLVWVGQGAVRLYSVGLPGGARSDRILYQAKLALDDKARLAIVREMYRLRFGAEAPLRRSVEQLRGLEGQRVREEYEKQAERFGVQWRGRRYDPKNWSVADLPNRCLSVATRSLYGIAEAAILAAGYSPAVGFIHTGKPRSFVYDVADLFKFETVVPAAFQVAAQDPTHPEREVRTLCRDMFRKSRLLKRIIPTIDQVMAAGGLEAPPKIKSGQVGPAFVEPNQETEP